MKKDRSAKEVDYIIGTELYSARNSKGISRNQLLDELGHYDVLLSEDTIRSYEYGRRSCSIRNLLLISQILELNLDELRKTVLNEVFGKICK